MGGINWICVTCSQGFTRGYSADRQIRNIHSGQAKKVRLIDYIVGRISGEFCRADPLKHRIAKHRDFHVISYEHAIPVTSNVPLSVGSSKSIVKSWVEYRSSNNDTYREVGGSTLRDQVNRLSHERGKRDTFGFLMTSPRLEEVENLLMSFSPPGGKRPPAVNFG